MSCPCACCNAYRTAISIAARAAANLNPTDTMANISDDPEIRAKLMEIEALMREGAGDDVVDFADDAIRKVMAERRPQ